MEEKKNNYSVYYHYNPKNGKYYIGITMQQPEKRWGNSGSHYKYNQHFYRAILRDGWDNFEHVVIESGLSREMAVSLEKRLIKECDSYKNGYNNSYGGESMEGYEMAQSIKDKISEANSGEKAYWYGKELPNYMIKKMSESHINHPDLSTPINQYGLDGKYIKTFPSVKEACRELGLNNYARAAKGGCHASAAGYQWRYDDGNRNDIEPYDSFHPIPSRRIAVLQYDLQGNFIKEYSSITEIEYDNTAHISDCCNKKRNSAMGYIWRYKDASNAQCDIEGYYDVKPYQKQSNGEKEVLVYNLQGEFCGKYKSLKDAGNKCGTTSALIGAVCRGDRKHSKGFIFAFSDISEDELQKKFEFANSKIIKKPIAQYDMQGNLIAVHKRARDAVSSIGVAGRDKITACCFGMIPDAFGYIWKYAEQ